MKLNIQTTMCPRSRSVSSSHKFPLKLCLCPLISGQIHLHSFIHVSVHFYSLSLCYVSSPAVFLERTISQRKLQSQWDS